MLNPKSANCTNPALKLCVILPIDILAFVCYNIVTVKEQKEVNTMKNYKVIAISAFVNFTMVEGLTEEEARQFCIDNHWKFIDENGFSWILDFVEED